MRGVGGAASLANPSHAAANLHSFTHAHTGCDAVALKSAPSDDQAQLASVEGVTEVIVTPMVHCSVEPGPQGPGAFVQGASGTTCGTVTSGAPLQPLSAVNHLKLNLPVRPSGVQLEDMHAPLLHVQPAEIFAFLKTLLTPSPEPHVSEAPCVNHLQGARRGLG